ncbi:MAG: putative transposase [Parcubacteria group bacterium Greene0714_21]|nr:MAG: putative transposase [Parcubacteria group bacterium Greene0416_39]TSD03790.1 MAG: putative transposase [Parcubacteria group bacterium Greene0714_21]
MKVLEALPLTSKEVIIISMAIRKVQFAPEEHYHLCARGVSKQKIFLEERDFIRFLFLILHFQAPVKFFNIGRQVGCFVSSKDSNIKAFNIHEEDIKTITSAREVLLEGFAIMKNHFHVFLKEVEQRGTTNYMQRVLTSYAMYFNTKYKRSGHVFEGKFRAVHVESNEQLIYLSAYIHRNPREIARWTGKEHRYPWSSYQDYIRNNRWGKLLDPSIVLDQFSDPASYRKFVEKSGAKEKIQEKIDEKFLLE